MNRSDDDGARRGGGGLTVGRLVAHGAARYQFRAEEEPSYYVRVLTNRGERTLWGKDLERALGEAETKPTVGDMIGARRVAREAVTVTARERDAEGRIVRQAERQAHRNRWVVEKVKFFADRAQAARRLRDDQADVRDSIRAHPELKSSFLSVRAAEEFALQRIADPADRERFLDLVRGALAGSVQRGEPLPDVRLKGGARSQAGGPRAPRKDGPAR
jgi:putative DNA primase/helicase